MINADEFAERRARLLALMDTNSALVLYSGVGKVSSADETYPFEVNRNFYYLTGIDQEDSALLLVNSYGEMKEKKNGTENVLLLKKRLKFLALKTFK